MKNNSKNLILLILICLVGLLVRLASLDKVDGLWNDEYIAWRMSTLNLDFLLTKGIFYNCHMPFYYLFLKVWTFLFGNADIVLRLSSVLVGLLNIVSCYFLGKEYKDQKTGLFCSLFAALSGFLIYFSQEVRLYGLIFLISTWIAFYFIKTIRNLNKLNFLMYLFCNFMLLITHTIGFVYVFFNIIIFSILVIKKYPQFKKSIFISYGLLIISFCPLIPFLYAVLTRETLSQNWGIFNLSKICFVFVDYFSPVQTNITNSAINLVKYFQTVSIVDAVLIIATIIISLFLVIRALRQNDKILNGLCACAGLYFIVLIVAACLGKLILSTKYSVEVYPILLLLFVVGITNNPNRLTKFAAIIYFSITSIFLFLSPKAPQHLTRVEGHKAPAMLLKTAGINQDDYIVSIYHQLYRYEKYLDFKPKGLVEIDKSSVGYYLLGKYDVPNFKRNGKEQLQKAFMFELDEGILKRFNKIFVDIPSKSKIALIIPTQVSFFSSNDLKRIASDEKLYRETQLLFLAFSYVKIQTINTAFKYCDYLGMYKRGPWVVLIFKKK